MTTNKVPRGPHYDADATIPEFSRNSCCVVFPAKGIMSHRQAIFSRLYVRLKETCSLASRELSNSGELTKRKC